jgi:enamine deaminase RidA (YjgF/YER057c/UK114 family)
MQREREAAMAGERQHVSSGSPYEARFGYTRAVRIGNVVAVSGSTGTGPDGTIVEPGDGYAQAKRALATIERALIEAGAALTDVIRTRVYVVDMAQHAAVMRAHREVFGDIRPASALLGVSALVDPAMLVEIEADAIIAGA